MQEYDWQIVIVIDILRLENPIFRLFRKNDQELEWSHLPSTSYLRGYLDLSSDGDVPFYPKNWYP